jgi:cyclopropane fatty-acyl-phospholipid synthase-like methyltransferase
MTDYWESRFKSEGAMWGFEPAESASLAIDIFKNNGVRSILIPGMGYGRNAELFINNEFDVTGIEISGSAIQIAKRSGLNCKIHHGSVTAMPFDDRLYDGVFCYALIHLLNRPERKQFLVDCYKQLNYNGLMIFVVASTQNQMYGKGKLISKDRFEVSKGLKVFFYNNDSIKKEFSRYGMFDDRLIEEPVRFMEGEEPIKLRLIICRKSET